MAGLSLSCVALKRTNAVIAHTDVAPIGHTPCSRYVQDDAHKGNYCLEIWDLTPAFLTINTRKSEKSRWQLSRCAKRFFCYRYWASTELVPAETIVLWPLAARFGRYSSQVLITVSIFCTIRAGRNPIVFPGQESAPPPPHRPALKCAELPTSITILKTLTPPPSTIAHKAITRLR